MGFMIWAWILPHLEKKVKPFLKNFLGQKKYFFKFYNFKGFSQYKNIFIGSYYQLGINNC